MSFDWRKAIADGDAATTEVNGENVNIPPIPDFTPNVGPFCDQRSPGGLVCTLHPHDGGLHVAGDGDQAVGIWYDRDTDPERDTDDVRLTGQWRSKRAD